MEAFASQVSVYIYMSDLLDQHHVCCDERHKHKYLQATNYISFSAHKIAQQKIGTQSVPGFTECI